MHPIFLRSSHLFLYANLFSLSCR